MTKFNFLSDRWCLLTNEQSVAIMDDMRNFHRHLIGDDIFKAIYPPRYPELSIMAFQRGDGTVQIYATSVEYEPHHIQAIQGWLADQVIRDAPIDLSTLLNHGVVALGYRKDLHNGA